PVVLDQTGALPIAVTSTCPVAPGPIAARPAGVAETMPFPAKVGCPVPPRLTASAPEATSAALWVCAGMSDAARAATLSGPPGADCRTSCPGPPGPAGLRPAPPPRTPAP